MEKNYGLQVLIAFLVASAGSVWVYNDAKSRGVRDFYVFLWMTLTFFALIIGLPLYLLSRPKGRITGCPNCGGRLLESLDECPHCGAHARAPARIRASGGAGVGDDRAAGDAPGAQQLNPRRKVCDSCGKIIELDWKFCPYCGSGQE